MLAQDPLQMLLDPPAFGRRHRIFPRFLGASIVAPGHTVLPLPPEFVAPQDGAEKQDCERNAAKRWLARHGPAVATLRPVYLGDDLFACQPIAEAIHQAGGSFILTCKPASHQTVSEYLHGATWKNIAGPRSSAANGPRRSTAGSPRCRCAPPMTHCRHLGLHRNPQRRG